MYPLPIGETDDAFDSGRVLTIPPAARRKHIAVFGKSGVGKSTLLRNMIPWDIEHGAGVAVEDPHGSLVEEILQTIPRCRWARACYLQQSARGAEHHAAVRDLGFKWIRILYRCWKDHTPYDEARYQRALVRRGSPLAATAPVNGAAAPAPPSFHTHSESLASGETLILRPSTVNCRLWTVFWWRRGGRRGLGRAKTLPFRKPQIRPRRFEVEDFARRLGCNMTNKLSMLDPRFWSAGACSRFPRPKACFRPRADHRRVPASGH